MATLADLETVLNSINTNISTQGLVLSNILNSQEAMRADQQRLASLSRADRSSGSGAGGAASRVGSSIGGGLGAVGVGAAGAAAGIGALGLAMPAFFGGLLAGDAGLGFLSTFTGGFDFENLKAAAVGFTDIITEIDKEALIVLAGLMGISAIGGVKAAAGLGAMGLAITAFLGGLLAGDLVFSSVSALGGDLKFDGMKSALTGFSDMILGINPDSLAVLGGIIGLSAVTGLVGKDSMGAAKALGSMGLGISAFLGGLLAGDLLLDGVSALGGNIDFAALTTTLGGFSNAIGALTPEAAAALAGILGASGVMSIAAKGTGLAAALSTAAIMTGIGAGISGLMLGLTAGSAGMEWIQKASGADGSGLASAFKMFNDAVGELNNENSIAALGAILTEGTAIGAISGATGVGSLFVAGGIGLVMAGIGAGIAGLMIGLTAGDVALSWLGKLGSGEGGLVNAFKLFNDSIVAITPEGMNRLSEISSLNLGSGLNDLVTGVTNFFAMDIKEGIGERISGFFNSLFGGETEKESIITQLLREFAPLSGEEGPKLVNGINNFTSALIPLTEALFAMSKLNADEFNFVKFSENIKNAIPTIEKAIMGDDGGWFGTEIKGLASPDVDYETAVKNIVMLRQALSGVVSEDTVSGIATVNGAGAGGGAQQVNVNVDNSDNSVTNTSVKGGSPATTLNVIGSSRSDLDFLSRPSGAQ
jgi:hypothetical protein